MDFLSLIGPTLGSLGASAAIIGLIIFILEAVRNRRKRKRMQEAKTPLESKNRIEQIESVSTSLKNILGFVESLKTEVVEKEHVLVELKKKHREAKKVAELDQEVLDIVQKSLSGVLTKENKKQARLNFFLGLLTGLIAGAVFFILQMVLK